MKYVLVNKKRESSITVLNQIQWRQKDIILSIFPTFRSVTLSHLFAEDLICVDVTVV